MGNSREQQRVQIREQRIAIYNTKLGETIDNALAGVIINPVFREQIKLLTSAQHIYIPLISIEVVRALQGAGALKAQEMTREQLDAPGWKDVKLSPNKVPFRTKSYEVFAPGLSMPQNFPDQITLSARQRDNQLDFCVWQLTREQVSPIPKEVIAKFRRLSIEVAEFDDLSHEDREAVLAYKLWSEGPEDTEYIAQLLSTTSAEVLKIVDQLQNDTKLDKFI